MSEQSEQQESEKTEVASLPEARIYFDEHNNLKMDFKNTNVYMVIGMLRAALRRLETSIGLGKPAVKTAEVQPPTGEPKG